MSGRKNLVAIGSDETPEDAGNAAEAPFDDVPTETLETEPETYDAWQEDESSPSLGRFAWVAPTLAVLAVLGWTAFFGWVHQQAIATGASPAQWAEWIGDWAVPVLLVVALWLLAMRNSRREAARFATAAQALSRESGLLERRLTTVNRELSLARDFIAAQSRDLESLGRVASERISEHAGRLQELIRDNGAQVETIGRVSTSALENMDRLRDDLPVISNSARDVASQIGHAGGVARDQLDELVSGFNRLNEFGEASGRQVAVLRDKIDEALAAFEAQAAKLEDVAGQRFAALAERSTAFRAELDGREVEAFAAIRRRADTLAQELDARRQDIAGAEAEASEALQQRLDQLREESVRVASSLRTGESEAAERWSENISALEQRMLEAIRKIADIDQQAMESARQRLATLGEAAQRLDTEIAQRAETAHEQLMRRSGEAEEREAAALEALEQRLAALDTQVAERQEEHLAHVSGLTERSEALASHLAELGARMAALSDQGRGTGEDLAQAAQVLGARLDESRALIESNGTHIARLTDDSVRLLELIRSSAEHTGSDLPQAIEQAEQRLVTFRDQASALHSLVTEAWEKGAALADHVAAARENGSATADELAQLEARLAELARGSTALATQARGELGQAIATLESASREVLAGMHARQADAIRAMAERIAGDSGEAIDRALRDHATGAIAELETAAERAGEAGRETVVALRDQLAAVNELAGNLEHRVAHARQQAEEQVDNDFARRMALITESLHSSAIDITKAFATDVTDTAWASYLRGDRGIFTRRAVRLLDSQQARAVADIYAEDGEFRETVNRYIHDFEALLRSVLSTRDGNALAVTLLSSDVGKLYVALAQAIERLRN
jgi:DNA repair exonuclease SbcCD ATPase subunit